MVSVGTGHGKSVIIQLLADLLALKGKKVVVVCLNSFLAYWGASTYGSTWVNNGSIRYVSLEHFLAMEPVEDSVAIFDEIDQMIGCNSFYINESNNVLEACYLPNLLTKWKLILGFSGTMSEATAQQLRYSFSQAKSIGVPSLRRYGNTNKLVHVQKVAASGLVAAVISRMKALNN